jgi:hypothetical protein
MRGYGGTELLPLLVSLAPSCAVELNCLQAPYFLISSYASRKPLQTVDVHPSCCFHGFGDFFD